MLLLFGAIEVGVMVRASSAVNHIAGEAVRAAAVGASPTPVSYTHLDVYKRQPIGGQEGLIVHRLLEALHPADVEQAVEGAPQDVYKRQVPVPVGRTFTVPCAAALNRNAL